MILSRHGINLVSGLAFLLVVPSSGIVLRLCFAVLWYAMTVFVGNVVVGITKHTRKNYLYVFPNSHFVDKARFLLRRSGLDWTERGLPSALTFLTRGMSAPTFVFKGRSQIGDSHDIAMFLQVPTTLPALFCRELTA